MVYPVLISLLLFSLLLCRLNKILFRRCDCKICSTYLNLKWTNQFTNLCDWFAHLINNSPTKTIHVHVLGNTLTANPENVEYILKTKFDNFPKGKPFSAILGDFLGNGIFNSDGDTWRFQRKLASLELDRRSVRSFAFEVVRAEIERSLVPALERASRDGTVVDLQALFRRFAFDVICRFSFGLDPNMKLSSSTEDFAAAFDLASRLSAERAMSSSPAVWRVKRMFNVGSERRLRRAIRVVDSLAREVIAEKRKLGFENNRKVDLLSRFMSSSIRNDDDFLRDIVVSFLLAGRDSVASALTSFFYLAAKNPRTESTIRAEANRVLGVVQLGFLVTKFEETQDLHYLQASIHESMRLLPPIQFDSKFCLNDDVLPDGTFVRAGTRVTYHPYAMGRSEEIWGSDCAEFRPERWLRREGREENPFKYPVFQAGFRVCLGKEMAMVELMSVALALIRRFRFRFDPAQQQSNSPRFSPGLTATFADGLPVLVEEIILQEI